MALKKTLPAPTGQPLSSTDERLNQAGQVVRSTAGVPRAGVFPHTTAPIVAARASMGVDVGIFYAALVRGGGALMIMNDGTVTVPIGSAPGANSQYKVIYVKQNESEAPYSDASNLPVLDYVQGAASATPDLASAIALVPAGGLPLAAVLVPSTATTTQSSGVTVSQIYPFTAMSGGVLPFRTDSDPAGFIPVAGTPGWVYSTGHQIVSTGTEWVSSGAAIGGRVIRSGTSGAFGGGAWTVLNSGLWVTDQPPLGITYSNGVFTVVTPGVYDIEGEIMLDASVTASLIIKKNSLATDSAGMVGGASATGGNSFTVVPVRARVRCVAGDTLTLAIIPTGSAQWSNDKLAASFFGVRYVEPLR